MFCAHQVVDVVVVCCYTQLLYVFVIGVICNWLEMVKNKETQNLTPTNVICKPRPLQLSNHCN
jgi:hypothetical protein